MVKFEFVVSDVDASNIMDAMNDKIVQSLVNQRKALMDGDGTLYDWFECQVEYFEDLKKRMTMTKVED